MGNSLVDEGIQVVVCASYTSKGEKRSKGVHDECCEDERMAREK